MMTLDDTLGKAERSAKVNKELENIKKENSEARSKSRTASEPRATQAPKEEIKFAFG